MDRRDYLRQSLHLPEAERLVLPVLVDDIHGAMTEGHGTRNRTRGGMSALGILVMCSLKLFVYMIYVASVN
jgi:hypothetical protein